MTGDYDVIVAGSGFAAAFFLHEYLRNAEAGARVLVLEKGPQRMHPEQMARPEALLQAGERSFVNETPDKPWSFSIGLGGSSNCWWACVPRMLPADFELRTRYGVGRDWPVGYDDLETYWCEVEEIMQVAGPSDDTPFQRSRPYPQPPHRFSLPDVRLKQAFGDTFFHQPAARPTRATQEGRPACCGSGVCTLCPINSKFTVLNGMNRLFEDPRVRTVTNASVQRVETEGGRATGVEFLRDGRPELYRGRIVVLAANALFNAHILLRSDLGGPHVGRGLVEQVSTTAQVDLDGLDGFGGSTSVTGHGYMFYDGPHRAGRAGALVETHNSPELRSERGKWRRRLNVKLIYEDLPRPDNRVAIDPGDPTRPGVAFHGRSAYAQRALDRADEDLERLLAPLPVEAIVSRKVNGTESHIMCTTPMAADPEQGVVDAGLVHHRVRNLLVLGSGVFPTAPPANPTLTLCALSLRAARLLGAG